MPCVNMMDSSWTGPMFCYFTTYSLFSLTDKAFPTAQRKMTDKQQDLIPHIFKIILSVCSIVHISILSHISIIESI